MANLGLRECDQLKGATNFTLWKCILYMLLEKVYLWRFVEGKVTISTDPAQLAEHNKKVAKA
jgi:hypothetical protein